MTYFSECLLRRQTLLWGRAVVRYRMEAAGHCSGHVAQAEHPNVHLFQGITHAAFGQESMVPSFALSTSGQDLE